MKKRLFGTDGVRGIANADPMTPETAMALGKAVSVVFRGKGKGRTRILIGKDTRLSGYMFETAIAAGICSMGADVMLVGPLPTPGIANLTVGMRAQAGIVISASHNPFDDNGIKFFGSDGFKLPDETEEWIERMVEDQTLLPKPAMGKEIGRAFRVEDAVGRYCVWLKSQFPKELSLSGLRIAVDCANGACYKVAPMVLEELGAEVITMADEPDGTNINDNCGAVYPQGLARLVNDKRCDVGLALDGDGDRAILVDENGDIVDGDAILAICAESMVERGQLLGGGVVGTVMSNFGLEKALKRMGLDLIRTDVGDRHVVAAMLDKGYNLGGEQSGHVVFLDNTTTGDGILTCLKVLEVMLRKNRRLSEIATIFERYPQVIISQKVKEKPPIEALSQVREMVAYVEKVLGNEGRANVRYSGTSPMIRVMVEGPDENVVRSLAEQIMHAIGEEGILA